MGLFSRDKNKKNQEVSLFGRLKTGLSKTRQNLVDGLGQAVLGKKEINDELLESIETQLLMADVGADITNSILTELTKRLPRKSLAESETILTTLKQILFEILEPIEEPLTIDETKTPFVILMVGVNGSGKTTTIGKLASHFQAEGKSVMLAAGDTFRAAAVEQLQVWGERNKIPVVAQATGADSAAVIYDALQSAKAKNIDILIADTAGRLHTQSHLMDELKKILRVIKKQDETAPHETMLVIDAGIGQNALQQAKQFHDAVNLNSLVLTKLDGTAKGGIIFNIGGQLKLPIRFIGVGEQIDDLRPFDAHEFIDALFDKGM